MPFYHKFHWYGLFQRKRPTRTFNDYDVSRTFYNDDEIKMMTPIKVDKPDFLDPTEYKVHHSGQFFAFLFCQ